MSKQREGITEKHRTIINFIHIAGDLINDLVLQLADASLVQEEKQLYKKVATGSTELAKRVMKTLNETTITEFDKDKSTLHKILECEAKAEQEGRNDEFLEMLENFLKS